MDKERYFNEERTIFFFFWRETKFLEKEDKVLVEKEQWSLQILSWEIRNDVEEHRRDRVKELNVLRDFPGERK